MVETVIVVVIVIGAVAFVGVKLRQIVAGKTDGCPGCADKCGGCPTEEAGVDGHHRERKS